MRLIAETLGVLVAAVLLARFALPSAGPRRYVFACLIVAAAVSAPLAFASMDDQFRSMATNRTLYAQERKQGLSDHDIDNLIGQRTGVNTGFTDFVLRRLPGDATYYLAVSPGPEAGGVAHWITWRMLPHVPTGIEGQRGDGIVNPPSLATAQKADWVVFYGLEPKRWALRGRVQLRLQRFAPKFWVGRRIG